MITYSYESVIDIEHGEVITFMHTKHPSSSFLRERERERERERLNSNYWQKSMERKKKMRLPCGESNPGHGGESAGS